MFVDKSILLRSRTAPKMPKCLRSVSRLTLEQIEIAKPASSVRTHSNKKRSGGEKRREARPKVTRQPCLWSSLRLAPSSCKSCSRRRETLPDSGGQAEIHRISEEMQWPSCSGKGTGSTRVTRCFRRCTVSEGFTTKDSLLPRCCRHLCAAALSSAPTANF